MFDVFGRTQGPPLQNYNKTHDNIGRTIQIILPTLDCSDNICGCHLLHSLCNHPFYKPLHPLEEEGANQTTYT
ncbi:MAG: hypothetical protein CL932_10815 [Deltaproteobacteria bacterium]|nr:hypothetical protein [Deltaproteobacteria bacterium]